MVCRCEHRKLEAVVLQPRMTCGQKLNNGDTSIGCIPLSLDPDQGPLRFKCLLEQPQCTTTKLRRINSNSTQSSRKRCQTLPLRCRISHGLLHPSILKLLNKVRDINPQTLSIGQDHLFRLLIGRGAFFLARDGPPLSNLQDQCNKSVMFSAVSRVSFCYVDELVP